MLNIVIPMAGAGSRFAKAGFTKPKPFIDVAGKPMIVRVLDNLQHANAQYLLLARDEHLQQEQTLVKYIEDNYPVKFVAVNQLTEGTACTVLYARELINNAQPLLIANSDQLVDFNVTDFTRDCVERHLDGSILCFPEPNRDPKWSYAKVDSSGHVTEVAEKRAISDAATVGIYLFTEGRYFVDAAIDMIARNERVNGEFYTCPTYNYMVSAGKKVGVYTIAENAMSGLGTPEDLAVYLEGQESVMWPI